MTPTSVLVSWSAWGGTQPIFYITNHRVTGDTAWIPNPLGLTQNTSQSITGLTGSTGYDVRLQGSNAAGVAFSAVFTFTTAAGGVVVRDVVVPAEWRGPFVISRDVVVPAEFGLSTFTVATNVSVNAEWTGPTGVMRDFAVPLEFRLGTTFSRDFAVGVEWGGQPGVSRDFAVPVDIGATPLAPPLQVQNLALSNPTTTSLLATWDDLITGPSVQGYTLEWKKSTDPVSSFLVVVPSIPEPIAPFAVSRTFAVPAEYAGHVTFSRDADVPLEWGGAKGASRDFVAPMEFGGATLRIVDATMPVDFIGSTKNVTRDFIIPSERKMTARRDALIGVEFRATAAPPPPTAFYIEIDLGDASTLTNGDGHVWGLANQSGGIATLDSIPQASTAPTNILVRVIATNVIWFRDASNPLLWRFWDGQTDQPPGGLSDPRYTNVAPLAVTGLAATMSTTSATLAWNFGDFTTVVGGGFLIRFKRSVDAFYGSDIVQPCVGPGIGQFIDTAGRVFSVNAAGRVVVNGTADLTTSAVAQLVYRNSQYWYHNTSGAWFFKALFTDSWASAPTLTAISVPSTATITMTNGHVLSITSDGRIQDNGVDIPGGSGSAAFTYDPAINRIYGLDDGGSGWYYYAGSGSWLNTTDPTGTVSGAIISNLLGATSYDFQVQAFNIAGNGPNTAITQATSGTVAAPVFADDFTSLALYNYNSPAAGSVWQPASWFGAGRDGFDSAGTWLINTFNVNTPIQVYTIANGILSMRLDKTPAANLAACGNDATIGGQLQTEPTFQTKTGYWEISCAVPKQKGSEFVAWMIDNSGQQEMDIVIATDQNGFQFAKLNFWTTTPSKSLDNFFFSYTMTNPIDPSQFHTYGIDWQTTTSTFYIDRVQVMQFPTPPTYSNPMFWILVYSNAQDEGGGLPLQSTLPSFAQIDYVKTWAKPPF